MRAHNGLVLLAVLGWAAVASAVPDGPGGTIYWKSYEHTNTQSSYYYLDVGPNWSRVIGDVTNHVTYLTSVHEDTNVPNIFVLGHTSDSSSRTPAYFQSIVPNATSGRQDMGGAYHNAALFHQGYYNTTAYGTNGVGGNRGADFLAVNPNGSITILNDGIDGPTAAGPHTARKYVEIVVPSYLTPNGEPWGVFSGSSFGGNIWTGIFASAGMVSVGSAAPDLTAAGRGIYQDYVMECRANYAINGTNVTGAIVEYNDQIRFASSGAYGGWAVGYKIANSTNYLVVVMEKQTMTLKHSNDVFWQMQSVGDTDGDGVPDLYYLGGTSYATGHAEDQNNDGDWTDSGESWSTGITNNAGRYHLRLVRIAPPDASFPGGHWVLLEFNCSTTVASQWVRVFGLNAAGDWDGTSQDIITAASDATLKLPASKGIGTAQLYATEFIFVPLNEPVATGVSGTLIQVQ